MSMRMKRILAGIALIVGASTVTQGHANIRGWKYIIQPTGTTITVNCVNPRKCDHPVQFERGDLSALIPPH